MKGKLYRTADKKSIFSKSDFTNWSYKLYTVTQIFTETIPSYWNNFVGKANSSQSEHLPENHKELFFRWIDSTMKENEENMTNLDL